MQKFVIKRTSHDFDLRSLFCDDEVVARINLTYDNVGQLKYYIIDVLKANIINIKINKTSYKEDVVSFDVFSFIDNCNRK